MLPIDYDYYKNNYEGSSIPESSFKTAVIKAINKVNYYTNNRININNIDDNIKNTICEIAEKIYIQDTLRDKIVSDNRVKSSETVGPHSVTYSDNKSYQKEQILTENELEKECYRICYRNLVHTGLMNRGIR